MKLASVNLDAEAVTAIYSCPPGKRTIATLTLCNRTATTTKVRVALTSGAAPTDADWIEYDTPIPASGSVGGSVLQLSGLALSAGQQIHARTSAAGVGATVVGLEQAVA